MESGNVAGMVDQDAPTRVEPQDEEIAEEWVRETDEPEVRGVSATRLRASSAWPWRVTIGAAEFIREDPLEKELREALRRGLGAVKGVTRVEEEDREVWIVAGNPNGEALAKAAADVVDKLQAKLRKHVEEL